MKHISLVFALMIMALAFSPAVCHAESDPLWLNQSEAELNANIKNDSYRLYKINTWGSSKKMLKENSLYALERFVKENYDAVPSSVVIDSVAGGVQPVYFVNYRTDNNEENFIVAKLVDEYAKYEDYEQNVFQYEYYQLFAISRVNEYPHFDDFVLTDTYKAKYGPMAIVPGMAQFYKGQKYKGYIIVGGEVLFVAAALLMENERAYCARQMVEDNTAFEDSWRSKRNAWRTFRNGALGCAAALYIFNIYDAFQSEAGRRLEIKTPRGGYMSFTPFVVPDFAGISFHLNF